MLEYLSSNLLPHEGTRLLDADVDDGATGLLASLAAHAPDLIAGPNGVLFAVAMDPAGGSMRPPNAFTTGGALVLSLS